MAPNFWRGLRMMRLVLTAIIGFNAQLALFAWIVEAQWRGA